MSSRSSNKAPSVAATGDGGTNLSDQIANLIKNKNTSENQQDVDSSLSSSPLPPDWAEKRDPKSGKTYYFNKRTKQTSWKRPKAASNPSSPTNASSHSPPPASADKPQEVGGDGDDNQQEQGDESTAAATAMSSDTPRNPSEATTAAPTTQSNAHLNNNDDANETTRSNSAASNTQKNNTDQSSTFVRNSKSSSACSCPVQLFSVELSQGDNVINSTQFDALYCNASLESCDNNDNTDNTRIVFDYGTPGSAFAFVDLSTGAKSSYHQDMQQKNQSILMVGLENLGGSGGSSSSSAAAVTFDDAGSDNNKQQEETDEENNTSNINNRVSEDQVLGEKNDINKKSENNKKKSLTMISIKLPAAGSASSAQQAFVDGVIRATRSAASPPRSVAADSSSSSSSRTAPTLNNQGTGSPVSNLFAFTTSTSTNIDVTTTADQIETFFKSTQTAALNARGSTGIPSYYLSSIIQPIASALLESLADEFIKAAASLLSSSAIAFIQQTQQQVQEAQKQLQQEREDAARQEEERKKEAAENPFDRFVASLTNQYMSEFQKFQQQTEEMQNTFSNEARRLTNLVSQKVHQDELLSTSAPSSDSAVEEHIRHRRTLEEAFKSLQTMHHETCDELDSTRKKMFELRSELSETQKESRKALERERERSQAALRSVQQDASDHMKHLAANVDVMREKHTEEMDALRASHEEAMSSLTKKLNVAELKMLRAVEETEKAKFQITQQNLEDRQQLAEIQHNNAALELEVKELKKQLEDKTNEVNEYEDHIQRAVDRRAAAELTRFKKLMIERTLGSPSSQSQTAVNTGRMTPRSTGGNNNTINNNSSIMFGTAAGDMTFGSTELSSMSRGGRDTSTPGGNELYNSYVRGGTTPRGTHLAKVMKDTSDAVAMLSPRSGCDSTPLVVAQMQQQQQSRGSGSVSPRNMATTNFNSSNSLVDQQYQQNNNNNVVPRINLMQQSSATSTTRTPREFLNSARNHNNSFVDPSTNNEDGTTTESETYRRLMEISSHLKDRLTSLGGEGSSQVGGGIGRTTTMNLSSSSPVGSSTSRQHSVRRY